MIGVNKGDPQSECTWKPRWRSPTDFPNETRASFACPWRQQTWVEVSLTFISRFQVLVKPGIDSLKAATPLLTENMDQWKTALILNRLEGMLYSKQINTNVVAYFKITLSRLSVSVPLCRSVSLCLCLSSPILHSSCSTILASQQHQLLLYCKYIYNQ